MTKIPYVEDEYGQRYLSVIAAEDKLKDYVYSAMYDQDFVNGRYLRTSSGKWLVAIVRVNYEEADPEDAKEQEAEYQNRNIEDRNTN